LIELARQHYLASLEHDPQMASSLIGLIVLHSHNGIPGDAAWLPELNRQVASGPIPASTVNGIGGLTECLVQSKCDLDGDRYTALIEATQTNPNLSASYASTILSYAAAYWGKRHHDYARAAEYEARAVAKHPRKLILRFNLAAWLAELGRYDEAQANLDEIRRIDTKRQQARKLVDWEERILALQTSIRTH
jgi:tetratricopeptide (TPR) repeat protein